MRSPLAWRSLFPSTMLAVIFPFPQEVPSLILGGGVNVVVDVGDKHEAHWDASTLKAHFYSDTEGPMSGELEPDWTDMQDWQSYNLDVPPRVSQLVLDIEHPAFSWTGIQIPLPLLDLNYIAVEQEETSVSWNATSSSRIRPLLGDATVFPFVVDPAQLNAEVFDHIIVPPNSSGTYMTTISEPRADAIQIWGKFNGRRTATEGDDEKDRATLTYTVRRHTCVEL